MLRPAQLVLATGMSGKPNLPSFPGMDRFRGDQHHSSAQQVPVPPAYGRLEVDPCLGHPAGLGGLLAAGDRPSARPTRGNVAPSMPVIAARPSNVLMFR